MMATSFLPWDLAPINPKRVSLCSPGSPGTHSVDKAGLEIRNMPGSASRVLGLKVPKSKSLEAACLALEAGYRHIDTAYAYHIEEEIGQAIQSKIKAGVVKREDLFITTKLWCTCFRPELVKPALEKSLKNLQLDYVDLYIMHYPVPMKPGDNDFPVDEQGKSLLDIVDFCDTWEVLEKCKDAGLVKSIGVSNFNHRQLERLLNKPGLKYKPVCNQVECHLYLNQSKLLDYCKSKDIVLVAYGALGTQRYKEWVDQNSPVLLNDPVLCDVAKKNSEALPWLHSDTCFSVGLRPWPRVSKRMR
ncbi:Aldo-keto reductase family 1 member C13 [Apodemus speciosus]|uniref:Aldo-keto reductase family 1 member C13 n=1 Tax=Apodemus speciosus TaxID=105296 RepID=A0ABQ0FFC6_APOSI